MQELLVSESTRQSWKSSPIRIPAGEECFFCDEPMVLVQSMRGGFVTKNCAKCGNSRKLADSEFRALNICIACPQCKSRMEATRAFSGNYAFRCDRCDRGIKLADLLPSFRDI